jgi:hypothetical protein
LHALSAAPLLPIVPRGVLCCYGLVKTYSARHDKSAWHATCYMLNKSSHDPRYSALPFTDICALMSRRGSHWQTVALFVHRCTCAVDDNLQAQRALLLLVCVVVLQEKPTLVAHWLTCYVSVKMMMITKLVRSQHAHSSKATSRVGYTRPSMPSSRPVQMPSSGGSCAAIIAQGGLPIPDPRTRPSLRSDTYCTAGQQCDPCIHPSILLVTPYLGSAHFCGNESLNRR